MTDRSKRLPPAFATLGWSNLAAQMSEQIALAAAPLAAVMLLGAGATETGLSRRRRRCRFCCSRCQPGCSSTASPGGG